MAVIILPRLQALQGPCRCGSMASRCIKPYIQSDWVKMKTPWRALSNIFVSISWELCKLHVGYSYNFFQDPAEAGSNMQQNDVDHDSFQVFATLYVSYRILKTAEENLQDLSQHREEHEQVMRSCRFESKLLSFWLRAPIGFLRPYLSWFGMTHHCIDSSYDGLLQVLRQKTRYKLNLIIVSYCITARIFWGSSIHRIKRSALFWFVST